MNKKKIVVVTFTFITILLLLCCCISVVFGESLSQSLDTSMEEKILKDGDPKQSVAVIRVEGIISSQGQTDFLGNETPDMASTTIRKIEKAKSDPDIKAVLLEVDSPGGEAYASKLIYNKLLELKEADKKLVVLMKSTAASGGYLISAPADHIVASSMTTTGSIGVIVTGTDFKGLYQKLGITEFHVVNSQGDLKLLEGLENKESESYKVLQSILDDVYDDFVSIVAQGRGLTVEKTQTLADGRIYSGKQAKELGLVDSIGELEAAEDAIEETASLDKPNYILYEDKPDSFSLYSLSLKRLVFPELATLEEKQPGLSVQYLMKI